MLRGDAGKDCAPTRAVVELFPDSASITKVERRHMRAMVLVSGGMDSITALYDSALKHEITAALSFNYGARHNHREIPFAAEHSAALGVPHRVIDLNFINGLFDSHLLKSGDAVPRGRYETRTMRQTVVPFRNGVMISIGAGAAESSGARGLVIAAHAGDHAVYPDCRGDFMDAMAGALRLGTYAGIELIRPFINMTKAQIAARGRELGVDYSRTWTCYNGGEFHCGQCGACIQRREAFAETGMADPTVYEEDGGDLDLEKKSQPECPGGAQ